MDLATLLGFIAALAVVAITILHGGNVSGMWDMPAALIVIGGSASVILIRFSIRQFANALKVALRTLIHRSVDPREIINQVIALAEQARKQGILSLEEIKIENKFLKQGVQQLIDGIEPEIVETVMVKDMDLTVERHIQGQHIFRTLAEVAPGMGMVGTLIGLVQMLSDISDPGTLGPSMALALLTTLYGAIVANVIAGPIADKLEMRYKEERLVQSLIIDAIICIQRGQNPRVIGDILKVYLPGSKREFNHQINNDNEMTRGEV